MEHEFLGLSNGAFSGASEIDNLLLSEIAVIGQSSSKCSGSRSRSVNNFWFPIRFVTADLDQTAGSK